MLDPKRSKLCIRDGWWVGNDLEALFGYPRRSSKVCGQRNEELLVKTFYQLRKSGETNKNER